MARLTISLLCLLTSLLSWADMFDIYGSLTGKTVLMPTARPRLPDAIVADLPTDKTNTIESPFASDRTSCMFGR